jgi:hypothetical protein
MSDGSTAMRQAIRRGPAPDSRWRHCDGAVYVVVGMAVRQNDLAALVVYRAEGVKDDVIWVTPLYEWTQKVPGANGKPTPRYSLLVSLRTPEAEPMTPASR